MNFLLMKVLLAVLFVASLAHSQEEDDFLYGNFPDGFMWGFATAAYQIEGGWDADDKGQNSWDFYSHQNNGANIDDRKNGDVACDSYHKYPEDVKLLKDLGAKSYRFSLSWSRLIPTGKEANGVSFAGLDYYNKLIDALVAEGIVPLVTLFHWDTPMGIQDDGGWLHDDIVDHYADYAKVAFKAFGDRVKFWISFNEPQIFCNAKWNYGASRDSNPFVEPPVKPYICSHNVVKAHAKAWRIYDEMFRASQNGQVGIALNCDWYEPKDRNDPEHIAAMERALHFKFGWWAHPLTTGKYPPIMRELVDARSNAGESRLPIFDAEWTDIINGTVDFLGLNHYGTQYVLPTDGSNSGTNGDAHIRTEGDPDWTKSGIGWNVVPWGFRKMLTWIHEEYKLPIFVTENGYGDQESVGLDDPGRQNYYKGYINEMLKSIKLDGADVRGYTAWTLIDNFEWEKGYTARFGVNYVDFNDLDRPRTPKGSAILLKQIFSDHGFVEPIQSSPETTPTTSTPDRTTVPPTSTPSSAINVQISFYGISLWLCFTCLMWCLK